MFLECPHDVVCLILSALSTLDWYNLAKINRYLRQHVITAIEKLTYLEFHSCNDANRVYFFVRHAQSLSQLSFYASHRLITDRFLSSLSPYLSSVQSLSLAYCTELTRLACLNACTSLQSLDLTGCSNLSKLQLHLPSLRSLTCAWCRKLPAKELIACRLELQELSLNGWEDHDIDVQLGLLFRSMPSISTLYLAHVPLSRAGLFVVFQLLPNLQFVQLSKRNANVWVDGTWDMAALEAWMHQRSNVRVSLV
ncbi:hypothetical protein THRCLA_22225 [Thraustotheca clavata]|uniref:F-box domain-containing protein n=1 Tax=Thraustotheca clavata TaxID=74557 RepID=A0A1V9Z9M7_9STRA|nr:hypothetical protein THRCLA_22225 [Thraustotheca clavata]